MCSGRARFPLFFTDRVRQDTNPQGVIPVDTIISVRPLDGEEAHNLPPNTFEILTPDRAYLISSEQKQVSDALP
jgi:hypothetical protein